jgi:phage terminase large subunit
MVGDSIDLLDYHGSSLKDIDFYVTLLQDKAKEHGYRYGTHFVPHDARPRTLAAGGKSILQQFQDATKLDPSLGRFSVVKKLDVQEGIQASRKTFPRCRFHKTRTHQGLECLRNYRRVWDEETRDYSSEPYHDWSSHGSDAFRYLSLSWRQAKETEPERSITDHFLATNPVRQTWRSIVTTHLTKHRLAKLERMG